MGEIAEMMLDGTLCEGCGVYLEGGAQGFPGYCSEACARARGASGPMPSNGRKERRREKRRRYRERRATRRAAAKET